MVQRGNGGPLTIGGLELLQEVRAIRTDLAAIKAAVQWSTPDIHAWGSFPEDGGLEPLPAGNIKIDFKRGVVDAPDKQRKLSGDSRGFKEIRSAWLVSDSPITVHIEPGVGQFQILLTSPFAVAARTMERVEISADLPFAFQMVFSSSPYPPQVENMLTGMARFSDSTISKVAASSTDDDFQSLKLAPRWDTETLNQDRWGMATLYTAGAAQKVFFVRNMGTSNAQVRVRGGVWPAVINATRYMMDRDIHVVGGANENSVAVAGGADAILETGLPWAVMEFQARLAAAVAAGASSQLIVEFVGLAAPLRKP